MHHHGVHESGGLEAVHVHAIVVTVVVHHVVNVHAHAVVKVELRVDLHLQAGQAVGVVVVVVVHGIALQKAGLHLSSQVVHWCTGAEKLAFHNARGLKGIKAVNKGSVVQVAVFVGHHVVRVCASGVVVVVAVLLWISLEIVSSN